MATSTDSLWTALLAAQKDAPALLRDASNPHFKSKFLSLEGLVEAVRPILNTHGLVVSQAPTVVDGQPALRTTIAHAATGEKLEDVMLLLAAKDDPQGQGSAITYARRYSLMGMLGLVAEEDDDGNAAVRSRQREAEPKPTAEVFHPATSLLPGAPTDATTLKERERVIDPNLDWRATTEQAFRIVYGDQDPSGQQIRMDVLRRRANTVRQIELECGDGDFPPPKAEVIQSGYAFGWDGAAVDPVYMPVGEAALTPEEQAALEDAMAAERGES